MLPDKAVMETIERLVKLEARVATLESNILTIEYYYSTWTPTSAPASWTNVDAISFPVDSRYVRIGDFVFCQGRVDLDPTAGGGANTQFEISIPITSDITSNVDLVGNFTTSTGLYKGVVKGGAANDTAIFTIPANHTNNLVYLFFFGYYVQ